jgi:serine/threonine protein kinase
MGEVYRARDTRLGREVAIKILPSAFTEDADRLARFEREARTLAALNHPHIAAIYGVEQAEGVPALVLELVQGETLADRLRREAIPLSECLSLARQIAEALEAAHAQQIVHRDLKPANIIVTPDGLAKVLDFGLAKAVAPDADQQDQRNSPTVTAVNTREGIILGTAAYMSPEQAKGRPVDKRADLWAFGAVLFEMLTGQQAFGGDSVSEALARVLTHEPEWSALPPDTPASIRRLLRRCLEKDRRQRLDSAAAARFDLDDAAEPASGTKNARGACESAFALRCGDSSRPSSVVQ